MSSTASTPFSSDGSEAIQRQIHVKIDKTREHLLEDTYDVSKCLAWIRENSFSRVALQFPDELLQDSTAIAFKLEQETYIRVFILGDTSYGSCCVDEVAAQHYAADALIHYGRACLSPTCRLPVLYVFGNKPVNVEDCCEKFRQFFEDAEENIVFLYDVTYSHVVETAYKHLQKTHTNLVLSRLLFVSDATDSIEDCKEPGTIVKFGRKISLQESRDIADYTVFYVGEASLTLTNFMMSFNESPFVSYDPVTSACRRETLSVSRALMRRYYLIEKAKDASIVGIVAGTLGVKDYLAAVARLKALIKQAGKKSYTFVMGKLNPAKLANFQEVDVYVLVACPENSLVESTEFYRPVVTPYELEVACNRAREWTGQYITDFRELLPGAASHLEVPSNPGVQMDVSLVTGKVRTMGSSSDALQEESSSAVVPRDQAMTVANLNAHTAGEYLSTRSWQGLEQKLGKTAVSKPIEGSTGIAMGYQHEPQ